MQAKNENTHCPLGNLKEKASITWGMEEQTTDRQTDRTSSLWPGCLPSSIEYVPLSNA